MTEVQDDAVLRPATDGVGLFRAVTNGVELRADDDTTSAGMPLLYGHFSVFNTWTEINSMWEGNFLERVAPGAYRKTFRDGRARMRALFQHGMDPQIGDKPLGPIDDLREDEEGAYYEVPLLDTAYNRDLVPGLEAGLYGASFRFRVVREEINDDPGASDHNPKGLPERTIKEAQVMEFGPVTFPAYPEATAGVRSLTDVFLAHRLGVRVEDLEQLRSVTPRGDDDTADETQDPSSPQQDPQGLAPSQADAAPSAPQRQERRAPRTGHGLVLPTADRRTGLNLTQKKETTWLRP